MTSRPFDPLELPLCGLQLIEASAGTGKTFNLAGLYLRLIVEREASVRNILVMTFTRAATHELRERIRRRLVDAARIAADRGAADHGDPEHVFVCNLLDRASAADEAIARRLAQAAAAVDEAAIVTIHGFAQRATQDNAFNSALAFDRGDNVDDRAAHAEAAFDIWRDTILDRHSGRPELFEVWPTPEALVDDITPILSRPKVAIDDADPARLQQALQTLKPHWERDRAAFETALANADQDNAFKNSALKTLLAEHETPAALVAELDRRLAGAFEDGAPPVLPDALRELTDPWSFISKGSNTKKACAEPFERMAMCAPLADLALVAGVARTARTADAVRTLADTRKRERRQFSYDDLVLGLHAALMHPERGPRLAAALRAQWPYALVDEFQDTDPLQYDCLTRIYSGLSADTPDDNTALLLIGDPKQAIYAFRGGDVYAYFDAARAARGRKYTLETNYRSSQGVLAAIDALFGWPADKPFLEPGIAFPPVAAASHSNRGHLVRIDANGRESAHPALTLWRFTGGSGTKTDDDAFIVQRTVAGVADLLAGGAVWSTGDPAAERARVDPHDIAVLVNDNRQAAAIQAALAEHGIAAVCQRRDCIFAAPEAGELDLMLAALAQPDDQTAVRSAEATLLAGARLADVIALADDDTRMQACIARYQAGFERWRQGGVLAALEPVFIDAAPRILALPDGERRMTNYLQLGERLAVAEAECHGMSGLIHWLERSIDAADDPDIESAEEAQLRLETDDALVRIATVHSAKGLEYPVVFMPYALYLGAPSKHRDPARPPCVYHDPESRQPSRARINIHGASEAARDRAVLEARSEALRLLYVGLTRAADALFITWREPGDGSSKAAGNGCRDSAMELLLARGASVTEALGTIAAQHTDAVAVEPVDVDGPAVTVPPVAAEPAPALTGGRTDLPASRARWSTYSFSRLAHAAPETQSAALPEPGAEDELADIGTKARILADDGPLPPLDARLSGVRFGSAVHELLEAWVACAACQPWPKPGQPCARAHHDSVAGKLRQYGLAGDNDDDPRIRQTADVMARTLHTPLPGIGPLAALQPGRARTEMGFMLRLRGNRLEALINTLRQAGYLPAAVGGNPAHTLYGLMQGFIDLVVEAGGRYYVLDYKTNRLGDTPADYGPAALETAIGRARYDLQYLIYTVALHRHLRQGLGHTYDPATHLGGVQYLFVRAMDGQTTTGVFTDRPDPELIETLDELFDTDAEAA